VILSILAQESPKSELQLQRYGEKSFRDLFVIFGKWLGLYLEILSDSRVLFGSLVDCGLILDMNRGLFLKLVGIFWIGFIFEWEMAWN
jgi:hypothetical protein